MTREAAQREAHRRNTSLKPPATYRWFVRAAGPDDWTIVRVAGLPADARGPMKTTTEAKPRPPMADDPRPAHWQNVGGPWALWVR
jgi:hypothetical protein